MFHWERSQVYPLFLRLIADCVPCYTETEYQSHCSHLPSTQRFQIPRLEKGFLKFYLHTHSYQISFLDSSTAFFAIYEVVAGTETSPLISSLPLLSPLWNIRKAKTLLLWHNYCTNNKSVIYLFALKVFYCFSTEILTIFLRGGQRNGKLDQIIFAAGSNRAVMKFDDSFRYGKPQTSSTAACASGYIQPIELFKDSFQIFF